MHHLISEDLMYALGWTVLHSLWQAMFIALLMAGAMILLQKRPARVRYLLANGSLLMVILLACYTFVSIFYGAEEQLITSALVEGVIAGQAAENSQTSFWTLFETYFNEHMPLIVVIWLMGMVLFLLKMLGGLAYIEYLKNRFTKEMPENWQLQLKLLINKLSLKREVRILESALVTVPMVIGWVKPVILIPVGAVNGLTAEQAEAVLAHELAHISRHDFLFNILQSIVEVLFYFNPAIWWISAVIRSERENCCDDIALELCDNRLAYAKALVTLEEQSQSKIPGMALAFSNGKKQTLNRIKRILNHPQNKSKIMEKFAITSLLLLTILVVSMSDYNTADFVSEESIHSETEVRATDPSFELKELIRTNASANLLNEEHIQISSSMVMDTLPKGKNRLIVEREDQKMEVEIEDGEIKAMKIDGKEIPKEEFKQHVAEVEELWETDAGQEEGNFWISSSDDNIFKFRSGEHGNVELFFDSEEHGIHFLSPDIDLKMDGLFFDSDGESIFVFPDSKDLDFDFLDDAMGEYKDQMKVLELQLKENGNLHELKIKELKEHQLHLADKYKELAREKADIHRNERIIIREKAHLDRLKMVDEKEVHNNALQRVKEEQHKLRLNNELLHNNAEVFILAGHSSSKSDRLIKHMHEDGLVDRRDDYKIELSNKHLKVNGKKQSKAMHQKYQRLYENLSGFEMAKKTKIVIENK
jgi:beta-lactamase regulating signal transducer with metallopeptidase domain